MKLLQRFSFYIRMSQYQYHYIYYLLVSIYKKRYSYTQTSFFLKRKPYFF